MNIIWRRIATFLILTFLSLALLACEIDPAAPVIVSFNTPQPYAAAQSTLEYGQRQMDELSHQATMVGWNLAQAANAAEQATLEYNQRQMMELAYQATAVSLNMAQAAATQQSIANAAAIAQSQAATATYSAYIRNITQTAQAQAILDVRATQTAQAIAALTAFPLTITPLAETQAATLFEQRKYERQSNWGELITPLMIILTTLVIVLLIVGGVSAFRRFMPVLEFRLRNPREIGNQSPMILMDGSFVDLDSHHHQLSPSEPLQTHLSQPAFDELPLVEIIGPSEPSIINWIAEAEQKLRAGGKTQA